MLLLAILGTVLPALPALAATPKVDVQVEGLSRELKRNVLASLEIQESRKDKDLDEARIRRLHAQAPQEIEQALQPYGHYKPVIHSTLDQKGDTWVARYEVDAGPILKVTHRDLQVQGEGASDSGFQAAVDRFPYARGTRSSSPPTRAARRLSTTMPPPTATWTAASRSTRSGSTSPPTRRTSSSTTRPAPATTSARSSSTRTSWTPSCCAVT